MYCGRGRARRRQRRRRRRRPRPGDRTADCGRRAVLPAAALQRGAQQLQLCRRAGRWAAAVGGCRGASGGMRRQEVGRAAQQRVQKVVRRGRGRAAAQQVHQHAVAARAIKEACAVLAVLRL
eukprot:158888-Chlamydomonas_euryale.AAC.1